MAAPWLAAIGLEYLVFRRFFATDLDVGVQAPTQDEPTTVPWLPLATVGLTLAGFVVSSAYGVDPAWVAANIRTEQVPILGAVTCHKVMLPQLRAALKDIVDSGLADRIHSGEYAGCYYPRFIAGTTSLSNHAFGIAVDLNVPGNQRGTVGQMDRTVVAIFKRWGFAWGGDWRYTDPMHFEMNALVKAG